jgi:crotonobetainyl-CoA:carnitine CoA-transferase CaiB-like acyl-CoA transferase
MQIDLNGDATGPAAGIRVLDLTTVVSGPFCTQILGDMGAEVIKVESPGGDSSRRMGLPMPENCSPLFVHCNRNKSSLSIDLKAPEGQALARKIASNIDVVIENFRPGVAERLGLGSERLRSENPSLIYVSINGFGSSGPYRDMPAYDTVIQGLTGFMPIQGGEGEPRLVQGIVADKVTALTAAYATLGALLARERGDGTGQHVDVPMLDAYAAFVMPDLFGPNTYPDEVAPPMPNPHRTWKTADGYIVLMAVEDDQFNGLCRAIDREGFIDDPRCENLITRIMNMKELFSELELVIAGISTKDMVDRCRAEGVPIAPVNDVDAFLVDPQVVSNRIVVEDASDPALGRVRHMRNPVRYGSTPTSIRRLPPRKGEQSAEILEGFGFSPSEIAKLRDAGVLF